MRTALSKRSAMSLFLFALALCTGAAWAADSATGKLIVAGKPIELKYAYAYMDKTGNDARDAVMILLSDTPIPPTAVQNGYARGKLVEAGTLSYVELMMVAGKQIHYEVRHKSFGMMMQPSGDNSEHTLETKAGAAKTVAGRARTSGKPMSLDDVPYSYDVTFTAAVAPAQNQ